MDYPEFTALPSYPLRSAAEADFDTKMVAFFAHLAGPHRDTLIALGDFLNSNSTIIGGALNATTMGLNTPAEALFTLLGIGARATDCSLLIKRDESVALRMARPDQDGDVIISFDPSGNGAGVRDAQIRAMQAGTTQVGLAFHTASAAVPAERMRINYNGLVGIGTAAPTTDLHVAGPIRCGNYTVATVPSAASAGAGASIYVTDEAGGATLVTSDGTHWRRPSDRAIIS